MLMHDVIRATTFSTLEFNPKALKTSLKTTSGIKSTHRFFGRGIKKSPSPEVSGDGLWGYLLWSGSWDTRDSEQKYTYGPRSFQAIIFGPGNRRQDAEAEGKGQQ